ncbi:GDSL-type esterase/lipase family protein [Ornithinicoccus hortensis]|uniref:Lysophospholipase L1-like esterase n=1 Tax=Ornithinicoccus hortensis TaxID=82346 RepID=A0A542YVA0_9MICO|nr:GDSL-type esterase/lipase family protein [Ornithinicoccus hortensis]TQL52010.1 lysophospholipase L1-like esterase [Ornithinicoccus hortensis]
MTSGTDGAPVEFTPSANFQVGDGPRDIGLCFAGDGFVAGYGDPKALGWVSRVVGRTPLQEADLSAYNLGVRGDSSADVMHRWRTECPPRWKDRGERRLVVGVGSEDVAQEITTARSRLNLANILDEATTTGISTFVVGPTPQLDAQVNAKLAQLSDAQADVCARRGVPFVDCFAPLREHDQWQSDLAAGDTVHPGQAGYGLIAWLVLHAGWLRWLQLAA